MSSGWQSVTLESSVHTVPVDDLIEHELHWECICGPQVETRDPDTGERFVRQHIVHHSLDGREYMT